MRSTITRRLVAGISAVAAAAATTVVLLAPSAADAGHTLSAGHTLGHTLR